MISDAALFSIADAVVIAELVLPLALGVPLFFRKEKSSLSRARRNAMKAVPDEKAERAEKPVGLVPLQCPNCRAPVPLESEVFPCPHCSAEVRPPPEYVAALADRRIAEHVLARAERLWRWSRWTSARPLMWLARLWMVAWLLVVVFSCLVLADRWPKMLLALAGILAILFAIIGFAFTSALGDERAKLPPLPQRAAFHAKAENGTCSACGAPMQFPENRVAALCAYCAAENYRAAVAEAERREASAARAATNESLVDAVSALRERRTEVLAFVSLMAVAEIFYGVLFGLVAAWDALMG